MDVACSTFCFTREPLDKALRRIAELEFSRIDLGVSDDSPHVTPAEVVADVPAVLARMRQGPTIGVSGVTARLAATGDQYIEQISAIAHLAKQLATAIVTIEAASTAVPLEAEIERLQQVVKATSLHGVVASVLTKRGTHAETPQGAIALAERISGLGLTLDPSHYICGPNQGEPWEDIYPYVRHVMLRDSGRSPDQFQIPVGRGEIDYSKIVASLELVNYNGALVVGVEDSQPTEVDVEMEVRKLGRVLESLT